jgi:gluconolactonase
MFSAPPLIKTEIFARVPDSLRIRSRKSGRPGPHRECFLEGPTFDRAGNLYCVDIPWGRIFRVSPRGEFDVVTEYDGEPNGLKFHEDGRIFIADRARGLLALDPASGAVTSLLERPFFERFKGLNDLVFSSKGDLYFTDQGESGLHDPTGRLFCLRTGGRLDLLLDNVPSPNGLALTPDESVLYVAATRANSIWRVPLTLMPGGGITRVGVFVHLSGGTGPDGMAMDEAGSLVVAHIGLGCAWVFSHRGEPIARIESCAGDLLTNMAYGGGDRRTLYLTESESGTILTARLETPGLPLYGDGSLR